MSQSKDGREDEFELYDLTVVVMSATGGARLALASLYVAQPFNNLSIFQWAQFRH